MNTPIQTIEILTGIKLFEYTDERSIPDCLYVDRLRNRINKDIQMILEEATTEQISYIVHGIYPQCYMLLWIYNDLSETKKVVFSEIFFVDEYDAKTTVVCCEKCKRQIDIRPFRPATHEYIHLLGEQYILLLQSSNQTIIHRHTSRNTHADYSCNTVCDTIIQNEIMQHIPVSYQEKLSDLAIAILQNEEASSQLRFNEIVTIIKHQPSRVPIERRIIYQTPALITALAYELIALSPSIKESLYNTQRTLLEAFMQKKSFAEHVIFLQDLIQVFMTMAQAAPSAEYSTTVQKALQFIHLNYSHFITLEVAALEIDVQPSYLSKQFKRELGQTFSSYLKQYRINRSILLMKSTYSMTDIALNVGFDSSTYFSTSFKQIMQVTPSAYRKKHFI